MRTAAMMVLVLVICLPPLLISLSGPGPQQHMEGLALLTSQETWQRQRAGENLAWLTPTMNGAVRLRKPPMLVWLNMLAWSDLDPVAAPAHTLILRARLVTVGLAVIMILATGWIGCTLGDRPLGLLAALIVGTMLLLQQQARDATFDMHMAAWATLAVAAALWAMQPLGSGLSRPCRLAGWLAAAIALALAWMSKGPIAIAVVAIPLISASVIDRTRCARHLLHALGCVLLAALMAAPWFVHLYLKNPGAVTALTQEYDPTLTNHQPLHFYPLELLKLAMPWTLWVIAGLVQWVRAPRDEQGRRRRIGWLWFVLMLTVFSLVPGKAARYILPIAPAMALLAASVWCDSGRAGRFGRSELKSRRVLAAHWSLLLAASIGYSWYLSQQLGAVTRGGLKEVVVEPISLGAAVILAVALLAVAGLGAWWHRRSRPILAALATGAWLSIVSTVHWHASARAVRGIDFFESQSGQVASIIGSAPLAYLGYSNSDPPDYNFLFFLRRVVPLVTVDTLKRFEGGAELEYVMAAPTSGDDQVMRDAGYEIVGEFQDDRRHHRRLWRSGVSPPATSGGSETR